MLFEDNLFSTVCNGTVPAKDNRSFYYPNSLIMKGRPSNTSDDYVLVFNKMKKTEVFKLNTRLINNTCVSKAYGSRCVIPLFVDQIDSTLFAQIEGVVDFNLKSKGGKSSWLLLLNIEGRPKYCFTFEGEGISEGVRHQILLLY